MSLLNIQTENIPPALPPLGLVFKLNPFPDTSTPFLVPVINRPEHDILNDLPPGIVQYAQGDLGVTETVFGSILGATSQIYDNSNFDISGQDFTTNAIPKDAGLKSFEKMTFQSMMESQKPTLEMIQILIDMLAIVEDSVCRFLGTSIKIPIINTWVGIPSKNPVYTTGALNYDAANAKNADFISNQNRTALNFTLDSFPNTANIYGGIPGGASFGIDDYEDPQKAYYIGYFDEDGNKVIPPTWVENSNKWFGKIWGLDDALMQQPVSLSNDQDIGVEQLTTKYTQNLRLLENEKAKLENNYSRQFQQSTNQDSTQSSGKTMALNQLQEVIDEVNAGVSETVYSEWFTKNATAQVKNMYKEPFISTAEPVTDKKGNPVEPFVTMPKILVKQGVEMEVPVVESENQLIREKRKINKKKRNVITAVRTQQGKNGEVIIEPETPEDSDILYFEHQIPNTEDQAEIKAHKIAEEVKNHYLSHDFEIVLIFEIRKISTGKLIATEEEIYPQQIDFENDYQLRVIRVINKALVSNPFTNKSFSKYNDAKNYFNTYNLNDTLDPEIGTAFYNDTDENDYLIPAAYDVTQNGDNFHYADILNQDDGLLEGQINHGLDPRYNGYSIVKNINANIITYSIQQTQYKVFWLVEAIKIDEDGFININGQRYDTRAGASDTKDKNSNANQKEWYGLLDKFTVIPLIASKLIPLIAQKFIPLLVKVIQILTDPRKLADLVFLIITEKLAKFFGMFDSKFANRATDDKNTQSGNEIEGYASKFNYTRDKESTTTNVTDGKAEIEIFGFYIGIVSKNGKLELVYTKQKMEEEHANLADQKVLGFILDMIKLPFELIKKIIDFFLDFIKKLVNPLKMVKALIAFITFKWLLDILNVDNLKALLGFPSGNLDKYEDTLNSKEKDRMNEDIIRTLQADPVVGEYVEVSVFHILRNGKFVRQETEERVTDFNAISQFPPPGINLTDELRDILNRTNIANKDGPNNPPQPFPVSCGIRNIPINIYFPIPLLSQSPNYNLCDLIQVFLKPMELILALLKILQAFIQALIALPFSVFGLAPHIPIPKIDFVSSLEEKLKQLTQQLRQNIVPVIV